MTLDADWLADLKRYPQKPFLRDQSIWSVWVYRFGRRVDRRPDGFVKKVLCQFYWLLFRFTETALGIGITKDTTIGPGLRIWHFGNIFIHPAVVIGANCTLRQGVTLGNRREEADVPTIGDNVDFGANSQVLGRVRIGNNARIGAMSLVLIDVPEGATAVGVPARILGASSDRTPPGNA